MISQAYQPDLVPETLAQEILSTDVQANGHVWRFVPVTKASNLTSEFPYCQSCDARHDISCLRLPHCNGTYRLDSFSGYYKLIS